MPLDPESPAHKPGEKGGIGLFQLLGLGLLLLFVVFLSIVVVKGPFTST